MKCQSCGKREATVKYFEDINGSKQELHFCTECAAKLGFENFSDIFSPIFTMVPSIFIDEDKEKQCPKCGYTFDKYLKNGFFGCPKCYETFDENLDELFLKLQGKNRHVEKTSQEFSKEVEKKSKTKLTKEEKIAILKGELADLVKKEEYEKAAVLRDKIRNMEGK